MQRFRSLRWRLTLATGAIAAVLSIVSAFGAQTLVRRQLFAEVDSSLRLRAYVAVAGPPAGIIPRGPRTRPASTGDLGPSAETIVLAPQVPSRTDPGRVEEAEATRKRPRSRGRRGFDAELETLVASGIPRPMARYCIVERRFDPVSVVQLIDPSAKVISCDEENSLPVNATDREIARTSGQASTSSTAAFTQLRSVTADGVPYRVLTAQVSGGAVQFGREVSESHAVLRRLRLRLSLLGLGATLLAALAGWLIARRVTRPIEELRAATERLSQAPSALVPVHVGGSAEVAGLATSFNQMVTALSTSQEQQRRLIEDASHELRTPLTSLRTNLELAQRDLVPEQRQEVLRAALTEIDELTALSSELVELAVDPNADEEPQHVLLADIVRDVVERSRRRTGRLIDLRVLETEGGLSDVLVRSRQIERAVANLVENAVKYAPSGSIEVTVGVSSVDVRDHGPGIAVTDLPRIFDRFFRSDVARQAPGSGLGLSIVRQVVERHGGSVRARNEPDGGATIGFSLPGLIR